LLLSALAAEHSEHEERLAKIDAILQAIKDLLDRPNGH